MILYNLLPLSFYLINAKPTPSSLLSLITVLILAHIGQEAMSLMNKFLLQRTCVLVLLSRFSEQFISNMSKDNRYTKNFIITTI